MSALRSLSGDKPTSELATQLTPAGGRSPRAERRGRDKQEDGDHSETVA